MFFRPSTLVLALLASLPCTLSSPLSEHVRDVGTITRSLLPTSTSSASSSTKAAAAALAERDRPDRPTTIARPTTTTFTSRTTSTTSSSTGIPTKTGLKGCNIQGTATTLLQSSSWSSDRARDVLSCQLKCMYISQCQSYSFQSPFTTKEDNCKFYHMFVGKGANVVTPSTTSGIFFSDKYPGDGTNFCYGSAEL